MRQALILIAVCVLLALWSCGGPDQRVEHIDPLKTVPPRVKPVPEQQPPLPERDMGVVPAPVAPVAPVAPAAPAVTGTVGTPAVEGVVSTPSAQDPLETLAAEITAAVVRTRPGRLVAVFPLVSPSEATGTARTSLLGDRIAENCAAMIRGRLPGVEVPTFGALSTLIMQVGNRGLGDFLSPEDPWYFADRIGADVVVMGTIRPVIDRRDMRLLRLDVQVEARDVQTTGTLGVIQRAFQGGTPLAQSLNRELAEAGAWQLGAYAPEFRISVAREIEFVMARVVHGVLGQAGADLAGRQLAVAPVKTATYQDLEVDDFIRAYNEERGSFMKQGRLWAGGDMEEQALGMGPVTLLGKRFVTLRDARDHLRVMLRSVRTSVSYDLSRELTDAIHEEVRRVAPPGAKIVLGAADRRQIEDFIGRETRVYEETGTIDPATIARLKTAGAQLLLVSSFQVREFAYELTAYILDMNSGERVTRPIGFSLDPRLTVELNRRT